MPTAAVRNWDRLSADLTLREEYIRRENLHDLAVAYAWSSWNLLGRRIRKNEIAVTWEQWNLFSQRLRNHPWQGARLSMHNKTSTKK